MNARAKKLVAEAMELSVEERTEVVHELLATLDGEVEEGAEAAWAEEIDRRADEALRGAPAASEVREFLDRAEARLRAQR